MRGLYGRRGNDAVPFRWKRCAVQCLYFQGIELPRHELLWKILQAHCRRVAQNIPHPAGLTDIIETLREDAVHELMADFKGVSVVQLDHLVEIGLDACVDDAEECVGVTLMAPLHVAVIFACCKEKF